MINFIEEFAFSLEFFLNCLELVAVLISLFTFLFLMLNVFLRVLRAVLTSCGLGFWQRISIMFLCRKSIIKKRAFIEFAILKTQGHRINNSQWKTLINEFKMFFTEDSDNLVYSIDNCTSIIVADFLETVKKYFFVLQKKNIRKFFGIQGKTTKWIIKINIKEAYATPTCLLTGLLSKYEENWEEFINRYVSTAYMSEGEESLCNGIISSELYLTFAWLLWGPSYELNFKKTWDGLCQLSYGDESNSFPAIADTNSIVAEKLKGKFIENEEHRYGALINATITLYEKNYYDYTRKFTNHDNIYFYEKIKKGEFPFAAQIDDFVSCTNFKSKKYYCTAYVWLLFETDEDFYEFRPEKSLAFFEHANLTDKSTYTFLIETLIDKSIKHFEYIFSDNNYNGRKYRFIAAFNEMIEKKFKEKYEALTKIDSYFGRALKTRLNLCPKRKPTEVFNSFDEFFMRNNAIFYENVDFRDKSTINDLGRFYTDIYMESFPDENERETFNNLLLYLSKIDMNNEYRYHIVLAKDENGTIVGGCVFNYYKKSNSGVIEFLAVKKDLQSNGIGSKIYKHVLSMLEEDARFFNDKMLFGVFCEIDSPEYSKAVVKKYLYFWDRNGYKRLDFHYVQPALSSEQQAVKGLWFIGLSFIEEKDNMSGEIILSVLYDYLKYGMKIEFPERDKTYIEMKKEIKEKDSIKMINILNEG